MKKILSLLIAGLLLVSLVACGDSETDTDSKSNVVEKEYVEDEKQTGRFEYDDINGEIILTKYEPYNDMELVDLVLPTEAKDGRLISGIKEGAFSGRSYIKSVKIPSSYEYIGDYAFAGCNILETVTIDVKIDEETGEILECVENIGIGAFMKCTALKSITLPSVVTEIPELLFSECASLETIDLSNVISIQNGAFTKCTSLKKVTLSDELDYATRKAFLGCDKLEYTVEDGLCYLGSKTNKTLLLVCPESLNIEKATVSANTKIVADNAFINCTDIKSLKLSDSIKIINGTSFESCPNDIYTVYENGKYLGTEENPYMVLISIEMPNVEDFTIHKDTKIITDTALAETATVRDIAFEGTAKDWQAIIRSAEWTNDLTVYIYCDGSSDPIIEPIADVQD